jgi:aminoglycoside/choline kinase family phosphotransferase
MEQLRELYKKWKGAEPASIEKLPGAGSNRAYYRITSAEGQSVIGCIGTSPEENHAFLTLAKHFCKQGLPVPEVYANSDDEMRYIQQDLGHQSLFDAVKTGREAGGCYSPEEKALLTQAIRQLPNIQINGAKGLDFSVCYPQPEFDKEGVLFDLNYFKYCFLKATGIDFHEMKLEKDFRLMAEDLTSEKGDSFLYRDFQARNVMLGKCNEPYFIDFQGGRKGPYYYDVASFLWQASALYSDELRKELIKEYYDALKKYTEVPSFEHFNERLLLFVLFRSLQVLGAYGFRGYFERKAHFIQSIPPAINNIRKLIKENEFPYPYLVSILQQLCDMPQFAAQAPKPKASVSKYDGKGPLVVKVFSFSYRKGIPADDSGNGGGYVFDCRSTHNPGRYEPYKNLTGIDEPVIKFLEDDGEILTFLDNIYKLADAHVARYIQRGFTSLMFCFGCTGGQHRSVYSAQHLAEHIHEKFGIEVRLLHREQNISQTFPAK